MKKNMLSVLTLALLGGLIPAQAKGLEIYQAHNIDIVQAQDIEIVQAEEVKPVTPQKNKPSIVPSKSNSVDYAFRTFILWVPGTSYSFDNYAAGTRTLYTSTGTLPKSALTINKDGTYVWNSAWDGKIIKGKWKNNNNGTISLLKGQEGKTWTLSKGGGKYEDIFLMDGSIWYSGKTVTLKKGKVPKK